jgi:hypothetical protein
MKQVFKPYTRRLEQPGSFLPEPPSASPSYSVDLNLSSMFEHSTFLIAASAMLVTEAQAITLRPNIGMALV